MFLSVMVAIGLFALRFAIARPLARHPTPHQCTVRGAGRHPPRRLHRRGPVLQLIRRPPDRSRRRLSRRFECAGRWRLSAQPPKPADAGRDAADILPPT